MSNKCIIVMVGPSGSGKTSIGEVLSENGVQRLTTTTTRSPREGEVDGVDYYFREFSEIDADEFVEQTTYNGNRYGLTKDEVKNQLKDHDFVHVSLDQSGAEAVLEAFPNEAYIVFVSITEEEMVQRMEKRGDSEKAIKERIRFCRETDELTAPEFADMILINKNIELTAKQILENIGNK